MQNKPQMRKPWTPTRMANTENTNHATSTFKGVEYSEVSCISGRNIKWYNRSGKLSVSYKIKCIPTLLLNHSTPRHSLKRNESIRPCWCMDIHSSFNHNSTKLERTQKSIIRRVGKCTVVYSSNSVSLVVERNQWLIHEITWKSLKNTTPRRRSQTHRSIYILSLHLCGGQGQAKLICGDEP